MSDIYDAGIETMFGLDTIKQAADHKHDTVLTESLEAALGESSDAVFRALPQLFASYIQSVKRHKGALFSQGSNQAPGHITEQVQRATMAFYAGFVSLAHMSVDVPAWQCRVSLLELVEKENLLSPKDEDAKALLRRDGELAIEVLSDAWDGLFLQPHVTPALRSDRVHNRDICPPNRSRRADIGDTHKDRLRLNVAFLPTRISEDDGCECLFFRSRDYSGCLGSHSSSIGPRQGSIGFAIP